MANSYVLPKLTKISKCNDSSMNSLQRKNFLNGLYNALNILKGLERSLQKSNKYEKELLRCKSSHPHAHSMDEWWENEPVDEKERQVSPYLGKTKSSRSQVDLTESWSTMSIVCMQYQYEELSKRYAALLQAYDERCSVLNERDKTQARLQSRIDALSGQLFHAHKTLLTVGEKYLTLRRKHVIQKQLYEDTLKLIKSIMQHNTPGEQRTRLNSDDCSSQSECEVDTALLTSEIRKCNALFMENLYLKAQMQEATSRVFRYFLNLKALFIHKFCNAEII